MAYTEYVKLEKKDHVATVILNRPQKANVISQPFYEAMMEVSQDIIGDRDLRCIAMVAEGKHFCGGIDLEYIAKVIGSAPGRALYNVSNWQRANSFWRTCNLPVVVGIQGACLGAGIELIAACDIRICADNAYFFLGEVTKGLSTDLGGTTYLTKLIGPGQTKRLAIVCEQIDAAEALRIGMVEKMVPVAEVRDATMEMARTIAGHPPIAVQMAKKCINLAVESSYASGLIAEEIQGIYCVGTKDKTEAILAAKEKRPANYTLE